MWEKGPFFAFFAIGPRVGTNSLSDKRYSTLFHPRHFLLLPKKCKKLGLFYRRMSSNIYVMSPYRCSQSTFVA